MAPGRWVVSLAAGLFAFTVAGASVRAIHSAAMPAPPRKPDCPMTLVGIDRTVSDAVLSKGGFIGGKPEGYGIFERWLLRLGWFMQRGTGWELFDGKDLVVFFLPGKDVTPEFRGQLVSFVRGGGRALIVDTPENPRSTSNSLLHPFGIELRRPYTELTGDTVSTIGLPTVQTPASFEVAGGDEILATMGGKPVITTTHVGKGSVTVIGCGSRFNDPNLGMTGDIEPGDELRRVYDVQYGILRHLMGQPAPPATTTRPTTQSAVAP
jgi:hypothetical protein